MKMTIRRKLRVLIALNALLVAAVVALGATIAFDWLRGPADSAVQIAVAPVALDRDGSKRSANELQMAAANSVPSSATVRDAGGVPFAYAPQQSRPSPGVPRATPAAAVVGSTGVAGSMAPAVPASSAQPERAIQDSSAGMAGRAAPQLTIGFAGGGAVAGAGGSGGNASSTDGGISPGTEPDGSNVIEVPEGTNSMPMAFEEMDPDIANDPVKREEVERIRDEFVQSITDPDGTIPEQIPLNEWFDAQWIADEKYRMRFGHEAWNAQQRRAAQAIGEALLDSE